jgi:hypothetical protein
MSFHYSNVFFRLSITHSADPRLSKAQIIKMAKSEFRAKLNLDAPGKAKVAMSAVQRITQAKYIKKALHDHQTSITIAQNLLSSSLPTSGPTSHSRSSSPVIPPSSLLLSSPLSLLSTNHQSPDPPLSDQPPSIIKKRRVSQDKQLVLSTQVHLFDKENYSVNIENCRPKRKRT